jgi:hypothetical protein
MGGDCFLPPSPYQCLLAAGSYWDLWPFEAMQHSKCLSEALIEAQVTAERARQLKSGLFQTVQ